MKILIDRILFDGPVLEAFESVPELFADLLPSNFDGLRLNVAPASEIDAASLAFGHGAFGVVVGQFEDGSPACLALECNA